MTNNKTVMYKQLNGKEEVSFESEIISQEQYF